MKRFAVLIIALVLLFHVAPVKADPCCQTADLSHDGLTLLWTDGSSVIVEHPPAVQTIPFWGIYHLEFMDNHSALLNRLDGALFSMNTDTGAIYYLGGLPPDWTIVNCCQPYAAWGANYLYTNMDSLSIYYNGVLHRFQYSNIVHVQWATPEIGLLLYPDGSVYYVSIPAGGLTYAGHSDVLEGGGT